MATQEVRRPMPFFVAAQYQAQPDHLEPLLAVLRDDFAVSASQSPGRRFGRVYRHHHTTSRLFVIEEWQQPEQFEQHIRSAPYADAVGHCVMRQASTRYSDSSISATCRTRP